MKSNREVFLSEYKKVLREFIRALRTQEEARVAAFDSKDAELEREWAAAVAQAKKLDKDRKRYEGRLRAAYKNR